MIKNLGKQTVFVELFHNGKSKNVRKENRVVYEVTDPNGFVRYKVNSMGAKAEVLRATDPSVPKGKTAYPVDSFYWRNDIRDIRILTGAEFLNSLVADRKKIGNQGFNPSIVGSEATLRNAMDFFMKIS